MFFFAIPDVGIQVAGWLPMGEAVAGPFALAADYGADHHEGWKALMGNEPASDKIVFLRRSPPGGHGLSDAI